MTVPSCSASFFIWIEWISMLGIKGDQRINRECNEKRCFVGVFGIHLLAAPPPAFIGWGEGMSDRHPQLNIRNIWEHFLFISGNCLKSREQKTIINWFKKPSTNTHTKRKKQMKKKNTHWFACKWMTTNFCDKYFLEHNVIQMRREINCTTENKKVNWQVEKTRQEHHSKNEIKKS